MKDRIAVVGGGVIGLSTALQLAEKGLDVTLLTGQPSTQSTSAVAAAFWSPYWIGDYDLCWAAETLRQLQAFASIPGTGVTIEAAEEWLDQEGSTEVDSEIDVTYWWRHLPGLNWMKGPLNPPRQVSLPGRPQPVLLTEKISFQTPVARMPDYLAYLQNRFLSSASGSLQYAWVDSLSDLLDEYSQVVNCTGWQAMHLVPEEKSGPNPMRLLAGHVVRVAYIPGHPLVTLSHGAFRNQSTYIVPRHGSQSDMICGGTAIDIPCPEDRAATLCGDPAICESIMQRCAALDWRINDVEIKEKLLGLRPVRHAVRLERDSRQPRIVHHYGHGGSGLTLSWGSAAKACEIIQGHSL